MYAGKCSDRFDHPNAIRPYAVRPILSLPGSKIIPQILLYFGCHPIGYRADMHVRLIQTGKGWGLGRASTPHLPATLCSVDWRSYSAVNMQLRILSPTRIRIHSAMSRQGAYHPPKALGAESLSHYKYTFILGLAASVSYISHICFLPSFSFTNGGDLPSRFQFLIRKTE